MNDRPHYPWNQGDELFAEELNAAIANSGAYGPFVPLHANMPVNVMDYGADPTGAADSTTAFRNALATGGNVFAPQGTYLITGQLTVAGSSQVLRGDGKNTFLLIDTRFDPTVTTGVILVTGAMFPEVSDMTIQFRQPLDLVKTATATSAAGTNTITVNSATGIVVGMSVIDRTARPNAIPSTTYNKAASATTVTSVAGNVLTLSQNIIAPGVTSGDSLQFASMRSQFKTLAAGATTTPGGTGVKYPWAIYINANGNTRIRDIFIYDGWDGIYIRGSGFQLDKIDIGVYDVGLDIDQCYNFPTITDYRSYMFGHSVTGGPDDALGNVYNDGVTIGANMGETDGLGAHNIQLWRGHLNLTTAWTWGSFTNLMLDGDSTNLTILGTNGAGFTQITNCYSTKSSRAQGYPIHLNTAQRITFTNLQISSAIVSNPSVFVEQGDVELDAGYIWDGQQSGQQVIGLHGTSSLMLRNMRLDAGGGGVNQYIALFDTATLHMSDCAFLRNVAGSVDALYQGVAATAGNTVTLDNILWNGWKVNIPTGAPTNWLPSMTTYANDAAAAAGGVAVGGLYRNGSVVQIRVT